jgi:hypothetical protein
MVRAPSVAVAHLMPQHKGRIIAGRCDYGICGQGNAASGALHVGAGEGWPPLEFEIGAELLDVGLILGLDHDDRACGVGAVKFLGGNELKFLGATAPTPHPNGGRRLRHNGRPGRGSRVGLGHNGSLGLGLRCNKAAENGENEFHGAYLSATRSDKWTVPLVTIFLQLALVFLPLKQIVRLRIPPQLASTH